MQKRLILSGSAYLKLNSCFYFVEFIDEACIKPSVLGSCGGDSEQGCMVAMKV